jgi:hypothetical protein
VPCRGRAGGRGGRGRQRPGCCSCWSAVGHASSQGSVVLPARIRFPICRRYAPASSIERLCAC